jgi:hypothetical protein
VVSPDLLDCPSATGLGSQHTLQSLTPLELAAVVPTLRHRA